MVKMEKLMRLYDPCQFIADMNRKILVIPFLKLNPYQFLAIESPMLRQLTQQLEE